MTRVNISHSHCIAAGFNSVSSPQFGRIHRFICPGYQDFSRIARAVPGHSKTARHRMYIREIMLFHDDPDFFRQTHPSPGIIIGHQDRELFNTEAGKHISLPDGGSDQTGQILEYLIACLMSKGVVDRLEMVNVKKDEYKWLIV